MPRVKGKEQLCLSEKKYFTSVQGIGGSTLFDRYQDIEGVIEKNVDEKFRHFLAQPVVEEDHVYWFSVPYNETPRRYKELTGDEKERYKVLKAETLEYYGGLISLLEAEGKGREAEWLSLATRYVNDEFLYCYDGRLILGIWGMQLRDTVREPLGIAMRNQYRAKSHQTEVLEEKEVPKVEEEVQVMEAIPELDPFQVRFISGEGGILEGAPLLYKQANESVRIEEVPEVRTNPGFEFMGWDKNPVGYNIAGDTAFTARYRQVLADDTPLPWHRRFRNWLGGIFTGGGCLRWLLWLLLLLLLLLLFCWLFRECEHKQKVFSDNHSCCENVEKLSERLRKLEDELDSLSRTTHIDNPPCTAGLDVVFVIDYTGSMASRIEELKNSVAQIAKTVSDESVNNYRLALVTFDESGDSRSLNYMFNPHYKALPSNQKYGNSTGQWITAFEKLNLNNISSFTTQLYKLNNDIPMGVGNPGGPEPSDLAINLVATNSIAGYEYFSGTFREGVARLIILVTDVEPGGLDGIYSEDDITYVKSMIPKIKNQNIKILLMTDANENILYDLAKETNGSVTLSYSGESIKAAIQNICP